MKCTVCGCENNYNANYCKACGSAFSLAQKEEALNKTWIGKLNQMEEVISWLKLDKITGNAVFRGAVLAVLIGMCLFQFLFQGNGSVVLPSEDYQVEYNASRNVYMLTTDLDSIALQLKLKKDAEQIVICTVDEQDTVIDEVSYSIGEAIVLMNEDHQYYMIRLVYSNSEEPFIVQFK